MWKLPNKLYRAQPKAVGVAAGSQKKHLRWPASQWTLAPWTQFNLLLNMRQLHERKFIQKRNYICHSSWGAFHYFVTMWRRWKKSMKRVIPDRTLIVKCRQGQVCYMLKSVVVHLGESSSSGHYISYTCDKYGEMVYNDSDVHRFLWNSIKENISTGGCLFFYINKECSGINAKNASTVKVVRRIRKVRQPVQPVPSSESIVY